MTLTSHSNWGEREPDCKCLIFSRFWNRRMYLRFDPCQIFEPSKTPVGLYARQKWLDEEATPSWQAHFEQTVQKLCRAQLSNGSWENSEIETVRRLYGLHLTVRYKTEQIAKALEWLTDDGLCRKLSRLSPPTRLTYLSL